MSITSMAFSSDGKVLASASKKEIKLWRVETGEELCTLIGHTANVNWIAFSRLGKSLPQGLTIEQ